MKFCNVKGVFALVLLFVPVASAERLYNCDGKWTNQSCDGQVKAMFKGVSKSAEIPKEKKLNQAQVSNSRAREANPRQWIEHRPVPKLYWTEKIIAQRDHQKRYLVEVTVVGHGKVATRLQVQGPGPTGENHPERVHRLSNYGGERSWKEMFWLRNGYAWNIFTRNIGNFRGYRSLQGCCSHHEGVARCNEVTGQVECGDGSPSPTCTDCDAES